MYEIEEREFGYELTFGGNMDTTELAEWRSESERTLASSPSSFGVLVDMRDLNPLTEEAQGEMTDGQHDYRSHGMERSAVLVESAVTKMQFERLAKESGIYEWERYVDCEAWDDPRAAARKWIDEGIEPDAITATL